MNEYVLNIVQCNKNLHRVLLYDFHNIQNMSLSETEAIKILFLVIIIINCFSK